MQLFIWYIELIAIYFGDKDSKLGILWATFLVADYRSYSSSAYKHSEHRLNNCLLRSQACAASKSLNIKDL